MMKTKSFAIGVLIPLGHIEVHLICKFGIASIEITEIRVPQFGICATTPNFYDWFILML